jgi:CRISPR-associated endonuclease/helicase Cas3
MQFFPTPDHAEDLKDLSEKELRPRYQFERQSDEQALVELAVEKVRKNEKILWVVNTVSRCQQLCRKLAEKLDCKVGDRVIAYHSRFRLNDRENHHNETVEKLRFDLASSGIIAVTTQVCEMSLDLDADRLISELAPIASIIQRCGRANRHEPAESKRKPGFVSSVHIYRPVTHKPYKDLQELVQAEAFVDEMVSLGRAASQRDLAEGMMRCGTNAELGLKAQSRLFESGYFAIPGELRDIDEYTVPAILDDPCDLETVRKLVEENRPLDRYIVPVPERFANPGPKWLPGYLKCAPSAKYSEALGFEE